MLEFHHLRPSAAGGLATVENIELRCRAHNQYEAELFFGEQLPTLVRERRAEWPVETGPGTSWTSVAGTAIESSRLWTLRYFFSSWPQSLSGGSGSSGLVGRSGW